MFLRTNFDVGYFLSTMRDGDHFYYYNIEFVKLGEEQGGILCIAADLWGESIFDSHEIPSWGTSAIRDKLYRELWPLVDEDDLLEMTLDLTPVSENLIRRGAENTTKDTIGILSLEQYRKYEKFMPNYIKGVWTCSPNYYYHRYIAAVYPDVAESCDAELSNNGYAPVLLFKKEKENTIFDADILFDM